MRVFSRRIFLAMLIFVLDAELSADEQQPSFTREDYHNMLSADLTNVAQYSDSLSKLAAGGELKQNMELVKTQVKQIAEGLQAADKYLALVIKNTDEGEMAQTKEHFESIQKALDAAENAYNGLAFEVDSGDMNSDVIQDNASTIHDQARDAEVNHHSKIREIVGVGIYDYPTINMPPDIKEDLEIENE